MRMDYEDNGGREVAALGYSWFNPQSVKDRAIDTRIRVCPPCIRPGDRPDVKIVQVPRADAEKPRCTRCRYALGTSGF